MDRAAINGVTVTVAKDGQVLFARGYGTADRERRVPVTPDTRFRIGSISKLFTWTAVMQLVEQHQLDLDADVQSNTSTSSCPRPSPSRSRCAA